MAEAKKIGELNGLWAILTRFLLATYPFAIMWAVWVTAQQFKDISFRESGPRYTADQAEIEILKLKTEIYQVIAALPPDDWRDRINAIESDVRIIRDTQREILIRLGEPAP